MNNMSRDKEIFITQPTGCISIDVEPSQGVPGAASASPDANIIEINDALDLNLLLQRGWWNHGDYTYLFDEEEIDRLNDRAMRLGWFVYE